MKQRKKRSKRSAKPQDTATYSISLTHNEPTKEWVPTEDWRDRLVHTNQEQAKWLGEARTEVAQLKMEKSILTAERDMARIKHLEILKEYNALKAMLVMLGREVQDE